MRLRTGTVFRTSRIVRDAAKLNQLVVRPLLEEDGEAVIDADLMEGTEFGENGGEPDNIY